MKHMDEEGLCIQLSTLNCFLWLYIDEIRMHKETPGQELLQDTLSSAWTLEEDIVMRHPEASMGEPRSMPCDLHPQPNLSKCPQHPGLCGHPPALRPSPRG
nr:uncharacterized protein LOC105734582 isoform X2 [Aotus nancymaae]